MILRRHYESYKRGQKTSTLRAAAVYEMYNTMVIRTFERLDHHHAGVLLPTLFVHMESCRVRHFNE